nr:N-carbamoylputrescine amidase [Bosea sp. 117]
MRQVTVAATQMHCDWDRAGNIARAEKLVRAAAAQGAGLILIQELFETPYFCQDQHYPYLELAAPFEGNPLIAHFSALARELGVVLPVSFFERAGQACFNSLAMVDADGSVLGLYRKSHIPDGPGYTEKFYFSPGDTGFRVWNTKVGTIGVGICWDQWFPECARAMALMGAEILLYPTAIGSEPHDASLDSSGHWQRVMQGHAGANLMPLVASNRIGTEAGLNGTAMTFYGSSFIADQTGAKVAEADRANEDVLTATFDLDAIAHQRRSWGVFRDRRPNLYGALLGLDGRHPSAGGAA